MVRNLQLEKIYAKVLHSEKEFGTVMVSGSFIVGVAVEMAVYFFVSHHKKVHSQHLVSE